MSKAVSLLPDDAPLGPSGPIRSNFLRGLDVPMPTFPDESIRRRSAAFVKNLRNIYS